MGGEGKHPVRSAGLLTENDRRQGYGNRWYDKVMEKAMEGLPEEAKAYWKKHPKDLAALLRHQLNRAMTQLVRKKA